MSSLLTANKKIHVGKFVKPQTTWPCECVVSIVKMKISNASVSPQTQAHLHFKQHSDSNN